MTKFIVLDGFHRAKAAQLAGIDQVRVWDGSEAYNVDVKDLEVDPPANLPMSEFRIKKIAESWNNDFAGPIHVRRVE